jgi:hypothetical protein
LILIFTWPTENQDQKIAAFGSSYRGILGVWGSLFNMAARYFLKATASCVIAYDYARIRRLVRLDPGLYRFPATAHQWSGLVARRC